jgi:hypothetical protein
VKPSSDLTGMYRSFPAYLWVEDEETRTYLETAWNGESLVKLYVAGGHEHIRAVVNAARTDWNTHVFGLRDRDFTTSNRSHWMDESLSVFAGDSLEVENLMLDPTAIASCEVNTSGLDASAIESYLAQLAARQVHWMACRRLISDISVSLTEGFVEHPKRTTVLSYDDALKTITESRWYAEVRPKLDSIWVPALIEAKLVQYEAEYGHALSSGGWLRAFSGKELLRDLRSSVWTKKQCKDPEGLQVFVRSIAEAQVKIGRVPAEVNELRTAILSRIGRA